MIKQLSTFYPIIISAVEFLIVIDFIESLIVMIFINLFKIFNLFNIMRIDVNSKKFQLNYLIDQG